MKYNRISIILLILTALFCISALGAVSAEDIGNNTTDNTTTTNTTITTTGQSNYTGPQTRTVNWTSSNGGNLDKLVDVGSDGTIYVGTINGEDKDGYLYALYSNGTKKWSYHTGGVIGLTIGSDGTIYVKEYFGTEYAFNPDGTLKWNTTETTVNTGFSTIGADGTKFIVSNGYLYAYNSNGTLKWQFSTETLYGVRLDKVCGTPVIGSDGTIYVIGTHSIVYQYDGQTLIKSTEYNIYAINPDGSLKWTYTTGSAAGSNIKKVSLCSDGTIYIINWGTISAINPDGSLKWTYTSDGEVNNISISKDGTIYFGTYGSGWALYALNPDGTLKWKYATNCSIYGCTIGADGTIYFGTYGVNNGIYALNPDGTLKWTYNLGNWSGILGTPVINSDGTLYVLSCDGVLYAFKDLAKITVTATPTGGIYSSKNVVLTASETHFSAIYYTTDGSDPTTSSTKKQYTSPLLINTTTTLKFAAVDLTNNIWSSVYTETYKIDNTAPTSSANINGGLYNTNKVIYLRMSEAGTIYYTLNGATPTTSSTKYTTPLTISSTATLKWISVDLAGNKSPVYTQKYTIDKTAPRITSTSPRNYATGVSRTSTIAIKFNKNIKWSIYSSKIKVLNKYGRAVSIRKWISGNTLYIKTTYKRLSYSYYKVYIPYAALKDYAGNQFRTGYSFKFKTGRY